jgi:hypothetical protein
MAKLESQIWGQYPSLRWLSIRNGNKRTITFKFTNALIALSFFTLLCLSSIYENCFYMPGNEIGFIEHPVIYCFFIIQIMAPFRIEVMAAKYLDKVGKVRGEANLEFLGPKSKLITPIFPLFTLLGLCALAWNSIQNQQPIRYLGFDFWDSSKHQICYWSSRIYKFYLWAILFPVLFQIIVLFAAKTVTILKFNKKNNLKFIEPFHSDKMGGYRYFSNYIINSLYPILLLIGVATCFVLLIHEKFDPTSLIGLISTTIFFVLIYFLPAIEFYRIILYERKSILEQIDARKDEYINKILANTNLKDSAFKEQVESLNSFEKLTDRIKLITPWPSMFSVLNKIVLAHVPSFIVIFLKLYWENILKSIFE